MTGKLSGDSFLDEIIQKTRYNDGFDTGAFEKLVNKWRKEKDQKKLDYFFFPFK